MIVGRRFDVRAGLQQRQGAAADEIDLEAEQHVVGARLLRPAPRRPAPTPNSALTKRLTCGAMATTMLPRAMALSDSGTSRYCAHCAHSSGSVGLHLLDKAVVELAQARRLMQVGEGKTVDAQSSLRAET